MYLNSCVKFTIKLFFVRKVYCQFILAIFWNLVKFTVKLFLYIESSGTGLYSHHHFYNILVLF